MTKKILMVMTSHDQMGDTGNKTGLWLEEFAAPYYVFRDAGFDVVTASPKGGQVPLDPKSEDEDSQTDATRRYAEDPEAQRALAGSKALVDVRADDFDAVFYPGGHGPLWDLAELPRSVALIEAFWAQEKPVGAVCHAPVVLKDAKGTDGQPLVKGRQVTGFTNDEEAAMGLTDVVPHLVEDALKRAGGEFQKAGNFEAKVCTDGRLVTGQNPPSSAPAAKELVRMLEG